MYEFLSKEHYCEYEAFLKANADCTYMQAPVWAKVKSNWQHQIIVSRDDNGSIQAGVLVLIKKVPFFPFTFLYATRGPLCNQNECHRISDLTDGIKALAKQKRAFIFRSDPAVLSDNEGFIKAALSAGFTINDTGKNFDGIQPKYVYGLNVKDKTADEIFKSFHSKTRYNIRLSERKGVKVRIGERSDLPEFYRLMQQTGERDHFQIRSLSYFENMFDEMAPDYLRLYVAEVNGEVIAGTITILFGNKVWYLYGASGNTSRDYMPNYLLQWEMIRWAIDNKCDVYDFGGISGDLNPDNPLYGLYRFKRGFTGEIIEFVGEMEMVFRPCVRKAVDLMQAIQKKVR